MENNSKFSWDHYFAGPVVGIIRGMPEAVVFPLAESYFDAGLFTLEITMNTKGAARIISRLSDAFPDYNIGAGTVCTVDDLEKAIEAGSSFIVTPTLDEEIVSSSVTQNIPIFPGAYTPTEIHRAWNLGASAVKVFPATQLGPQYIKDVLAPLDQVKLLPTGGVSLENISAFFQAGAVGVGMGSSLFDKKMIENQDYQGLKQHFRKIRAAIEPFIKDMP